LILNASRLTWEISGAHCGSPMLGRNRDGFIFSGQAV